MSQRKNPVHKEKGSKTLKLDELSDDEKDTVKVQKANEEIEEALRKREQLIKEKEKLFEREYELYKKEERYFSDSNFEKFLNKKTLLSKQMQYVDKEINSDEMERAVTTAKKIHNYKRQVNEEEREQKRRDEESKRKNDENKRMNELHKNQIIKGNLILIFSIIFCFLGIYTMLQGMEKGFMVFGIAFIIGCSQAKNNENGLLKNFFEWLKG